MSRSTARKATASRARALLAVAAVLGAPGAPPRAAAQGRFVDVATAEALLAAVADAAPGDLIRLAEGTYELGHRVAVTRPGRADAPIVLRAGTPGGAVVHFSDGAGVVEGWHVRAPHWTFEGLDIVGGCAPSAHDRCEHAFHVVGAADHTAIVGNRMWGFNAQIKGNGELVDGVRAFPDDVLVEGNELFNPTPRQTGNPVTPIDVVGGRRWVLRANHIHDFAKAGGNQISYAAFLKGHSRDGLMERNLVVCEALHHGQIRLGLSLGGGGSAPESICEGGSCTPEHEGGVLRNNIVAHCPADVGIYLNAAADARVLHNLLLDTGGGVDVRFAASTATLAGNVMSGRIRERDGGRATRADNLEGVTPARFAAWFRNPTALDLALLDGGELVDRGAARADLTDDFCARARSDGAPDLGPIEYDGPSPCDASRAHPAAPAAPTPSPTEPPATSSPTPGLAMPSPTARPTALPGPAGPIYLPVALAHRAGAARATD